MYVIVVVWSLASVCPKNYEDPTFPTFSPLPSLLLLSTRSIPFLSSARIFPLKSSRGLGSAVRLPQWQTWPTLLRSRIYFCKRRIPLEICNCQSNSVRVRTRAPSRGVGLFYLFKTHFVSGFGFIE